MTSSNYLTAYTEILKLTPYALKNTSLKTYINSLEKNLYAACLQQQMYVTVCFEQITLSVVLGIKRLQKYSVLTAIQKCFAH